MYIPDPLELMETRIEMNELKNDEPWKKFAKAAKLKEKVLDKKKIVKKVPNFDPAFPENFAWDRLDSKMFCAITLDIKLRIKNDLETKDRNLVPGLREALRIIINYVIDWD